MFITIVSTIFFTVVISKLIAWTCNKFEPAANYLGRNWPAGIKGATINAIGSSMPEFWTTVALLFFISHNKDDLLGASISVGAGSAIFNTIFIPMCVIFAVISPIIIRVFTFGLFTEKIKLTKKFKVDKLSCYRDTFFLLVSEIFLIFVLFHSEVSLIHCIILLLIYGAYCVRMYNSCKNYETENKHIQGWNNKSAWFRITWTVLILVVSCYLLGELIIRSADALGVNAMITALFLGAAASSVPDTILSVKDARSGEYENAISNALGSNTFDICVALGLPMLVYILLNGNITLPQSEMLNVLRIGLLVFTAITLIILLFPRWIRLWQGYVLLGLYIVWSFFVLNCEFAWI